MKPFLRALLWPALVGGMLRLAILAVTLHQTGTQIMTQGDTTSYLEPVRDLLIHGIYATGGLPETDRTPGYPLFLLLTGATNGNVIPAAVAQIVLSLITLLSIFSIVRRIVPGNKAGQIAAWLYALEPTSIAYSIRLMPETLFVCLLTGCLDRLIGYQRSGRVRELLQASLLLIAATYVRPVSYYLVLPYALAIAIRAGGKTWKNLSHSAIFLLLAVALLGAWQVRNWKQTGYSGFSSVVEKNLYFYQAAAISATLSHRSFAEEQRFLGYGDESGYLAVHPEQKMWPLAQRLAYMRSEASQLLAAHPWMYARSHFAGVGLVAFTPCAADFLQLLSAYPKDNAAPQRVVSTGIVSSAWQILTRYPTVGRTMLAFEGYLFLLYLGAAAAFRRSIHRWVLALLTGTALYFLLISGGAQAVGRYRLPAIPILCVLAGCGLSARQVRRREAQIGSTAADV